MSDLLSQDFLTALLAGGLVAAVPLLFASLGELVSEQAGVLNVGLEGYMLFGAFLDAAAERRASEALADIDSLTLGVNAGTLITYDREALRRWQSRHPRQQTPQDYTATANRLAQMFPQKVTTH